MSLRFFLTESEPCAYLTGRDSRKFFTHIGGKSPNRANEWMSQNGFRRSGEIVYKPFCKRCSSCIPVRVRVAASRPSRNQRKTLNRNADLRRMRCEPVARPHQYDLFHRYVKARHRFGGMAEMTSGDFEEMINSSPVTSYIFEYRQGNKNDGAKSRLVAASYVDLLTSGLSMVYSFFDPEIPKRSLGTFMILDHIELARSLGLQFVYLGYWVPGSPKMEYKSRFRGIEILRNTRWITYGGKGTHGV